MFLNQTEFHHRLVTSHKDDKCLLWTITGVYEMIQQRIYHHPELFSSFFPLLSVSRSPTVASNLHLNVSDNDWDFISPGVIMYSLWSETTLTSAFQTHWKPLKFSRMVKSHSWSPLSCTHHNLEAGVWSWLVNGKASSPSDIMAASISIRDRHSKC